MKIYGDFTNNIRKIKKSYGLTGILCYYKILNGVILHVWYNRLFGGHGRLEPRDIKLNEKTH